MRRFKNQSNIESGGRSDLNLVRLRRTQLSHLIDTSIKLSKCSVKGSGRYSGSNSVRKCLRETFLS